MKAPLGHFLVLALCCWSLSADAQGFGGLLDPLSSVLGSVTAPLGPINIVGSPAVDVDTRVGSPSTVIDKTPASSRGGGINIVTPSFVRVKTDVDSEKTEVRTSPTAGGNNASPTSPSFGGLNLVGSPAIDVGTDVGSPSTVVGAKSSGVNVVSPSFVRVKTNVDSENTQVYKPAGVRAESPSIVDPDVAMALAPRPRPSSVSALASVLASVLGAGTPATPPPPATATPPPSTPVPTATPPSVQSYTPIPSNNPSGRALRG